MDNDQIHDFVVESNRIEGITREPALGELKITQWLFGLDRLIISDIEKFVQCCQPGAKLRRAYSQNVRVGNHKPPMGGPHIVEGLGRILECVSTNEVTAYLNHQAYETLHPFMDGNGRSGRAVWAWQMINHGSDYLLSLGFLHAWYYQSLEHNPHRGSARA